MLILILETLGYQSLLNALIVKISYFRLQEFPDLRSRDDPSTSSITIYTVTSLCLYPLPHSVHRHTADVRLYYCITDNFYRAFRSDGGTERISQSG